MLKVPFWKTILVLIVVFLSIIFSIPSFFPESAFVSRVFPDKKVSLGLDLRGGSYLLLEMQFDAYDREQYIKNADLVRSTLRSNSVSASNFVVSPSEISISFADEAKKSEAIAVLKKELGEVFVINSEHMGLVLKPNQEFIKSQRAGLIAQTIEIVRRRIDETGTKELDLQRQGDDYILLQVPGIDDPNQIKKLLGKTAKLTFHLVEGVASSGEASPSLSQKVLPFEDNGRTPGRALIVNSRPIITGEMLVDAQSTVNNGAPVVSFKFNNLGAKLFGDISTKNVGKMLAIVLDNVVISAPAIREPILSGSGVIAGNFTVQSSSELALLLRAGALPVPLQIVEERTVGPSLGADSIESGATAAIVGTLMVVVFMFVFYYFFGMIANVALILNFFLIISCLSIFGATLTLPGIAGIVLTLGMAVDANVLIFERIREELGKGRSPLNAIESGYNMAFATILDSNLTTVLVAVILYLFGAGPVKGFAVTLTIGILCSMFTAVFVTKIIVAYWYRRTRPAALNI